MSDLLFEGIAGTVDNALLSLCWDLLSGDITVFEAFPVDLDEPYAGTGLAQLPADGRRGDHPDAEVFTLGIVV